MLHVNILNKDDFASPNPNTDFLSFNQKLQQLHYQFPCKETAVLNHIQFLGSNIAERIEEWGKCHRSSRGRNNCQLEEYDTENLNQAFKNG